MMVSVITPTYNCGSYLRGAIESVIAQGDGVEHIVVDGGSRDGTVALLREYQMLRWISEPDHGMYDAINKGIRMSHGEIVAYLNADDRYAVNAIRMVVEGFKSNPEIQFVYGQCEMVDENENPLFVMRPLAYRWLKYSRRVMWPQPTWFWRRSVHERVGYFDNSLRFAGDFELMSRFITERVPGLRLNSVLARFMYRRDSISARKECKQEVMACREKIGSYKWTLSRAGIEALFAVKNIHTYPARLRYRV